MTAPRSIQSLAGRVGGLRAAANMSPEARRERGRRGQAALVSAFLARIDPEGRLSPAERAAAVEADRRARMAALTLRRVQARRRAS